MGHEFTAAEIFAALRPLLGDAPAWQVAEDARAPVDLDARRAEPLRNAEGPGLAYRPVPTVNFTTDTLLLLSLVSEETAAKVARHRAALYRGAAPEAAEREWQRRRAEMAAWRDAGFVQAGGRKDGPDPAAP
jgi:hypothetical protein